MLEDAAIEVAQTPREALFLAGKVSLQYRKAGGARTGVLPVFFIGAHAAVSGLLLLTRDGRRYRTHFFADGYFLQRPLLAVHSYPNAFIQRTM